MDKVAAPAEVEVSTEQMDFLDFCQMRAYMVSEYSLPQRHFVMATAGYSLDEWSEILLQRVRGEW